MSDRCTIVQRVDTFWTQVLSMELMYGGGMPSMTHSPGGGGMDSHGGDSHEPPMPDSAAAAAGK